ncbi:MAG: YceI family protein [Bacteroidetes bacterium]|nr:YceI family protein [Bacteroidota bacterium]MBS1630118.1 YceI family protein [Bacteroidota bacterium]
MKRNLLFSFLGIGAGLLASCQSDPKADKAQTGAAVKIEASSGHQYQADLNQSRVEWTGSKPIGKHHGSFNLQTGSLSLQDGNITGGLFVMDMNSLNVLDEDTNGIFKLSGHLMSNDFFDVAAYPTARFEISSVTPGVTASSDELVMKDATHTVTGNLTLKGVTKSISFPARISVEHNQVMAQANFNIDRTNWGLVYGNDKSLGDKFIRPTVNIGLQLVAQVNG